MFIAFFFVVFAFVAPNPTAVRGGAMLKGIGQAARAEIEQALGRRVYLELWVKVVPRSTRRSRLGVSTWG